MTILGAFGVGVASLLLAAIGVRWLLWSFEVVEDRGC